ncbi:stathmin domain-containing protein 1 isoform X2 [Manis pentadactyla]|uniref:stathmin domain-containing protein 1 isoform X2 n=1 Tax=Manis pentadactyla TaxID=143292 RepID=UPI00255C6229|nr:stathmin domain-containing protein 1 isoform X2 [Manis pentadactyla]
MGCTPSRPADDERRVSAPGKGVQADVGAADSRGTCSPQMEAVLPRDTVSSPEGLEKQAQLGSLPGTVLESSTPLSERNGRVNSVLGSGGPIRKPQALENGERPKSSDILEELIVQGIIQSHSKGSRNGESDDIMANTAKAPLRKPPARLEKLKIDKEAKAFPVKVRAEGQRAVEPGRKAPQLLQEVEEEVEGLWGDGRWPPGSPSGPAEAGGAEHPLAKGPQAGRGPADPQDGKLLRREASRGAAASRARNFSYGGIGAVESDVSYNQADDEF